MNLYLDSAQFLEKDLKSKSLHTRVFSAHEAKTIKSDPRRVLALVSSTLQLERFIIEITDSTGIFKAERRLPHDVGILLVHDLLFSKTGITAGKGKFKDAVLRHKTRLKSELARLKIKLKVKDLRELVVSDENEQRSNRPPVRWFRVSHVKWWNKPMNTSFESLCKILGLKLTESWTDLLNKGADCKLIYKDSLVEDVYAVPMSFKLTSTSLYKKGHVIIQDRASCFPAWLLRPEPGQVLIDACAAPGNKTSHMASIMKNKGSITAFERNKERTGVLSKMMNIAGASCVKIVNEDFLKSDPADFTDVSGILVDPSCSGSGIFRQEDQQQQGEAEQDDDDDGDGDLNGVATERSNAELSRRLLNLAEFQTKIVKHALSFPAVHKVVYSTCSIHAEENEEVVRNLLMDEDVQSGCWTLESKSRALPTWTRRGLVAPFEGLKDPESLAESCIRVEPVVDGGIGFFAAVFVKKK